ncbi:hypothetical protein P691DRAFT_790010 [Macrolepiota fuliginosa MF-IS2]|uniref:Uncharacterized protein n=1 Tax=Macrolepiota fuliginosa MF-IS2 TaxID=1400762 RepID=A0A9P5WZZ3_9AGAR|nr:hypothetical protein P691DRAFT_790010 [Macrolepiota fuliginosa MF-IS2]
MLCFCLHVTLFKAFILSQAIWQNTSGDKQEHIVSRNFNWLNGSSGCVTNGNGKLRNGCLLMLFEPNSHLWLYPCQENGGVEEGVGQEGDGVQGKKGEKRRLDAIARERDAIKRSWDFPAVGAAAAAAVVGSTATSCRKMAILSQGVMHKYAGLSVRLQTRCEAIEIEDQGYK